MSIQIVVIEIMGATDEEVKSAFEGLETVETETRSIDGATYKFDASYIGRTEVH